MPLRVIFSFVLVACTGFAAFAYFEIPAGRIELVDQVHAAINALSRQPNDPAAYGARVMAHELDDASRLRQTEGCRLFHHAPSGRLTREVALSFGTPDGPATAAKICKFLLRDGFVQKIEARFPTMARTDRHQIILEVGTAAGVQGPVAALKFAFQYAGFIRQGEPRRIADFGEAIMRKEVNARCWIDPGFNPHPPRLADVSETAIITDLPGEPDTAAAQDKVFLGNRPSIFKQAALIVDDAASQQSDTASSSPAPAPSPAESPASPIALPDVPVPAGAPALRRAVAETAQAPSDSNAEAFAGERKERIAEFQQQLDNVDVDIRVAQDNHTGAWSSHCDSSGAEHPNSVGITQRERLQYLESRRALIAEKIEKLQRGDPVSSVMSEASSSDTGSMSDVPRL